MKRDLINTDFKFGKKMEEQKFEEIEDTAAKNAKIVKKHLENLETSDHSPTYEHGN